MKVQKLFSLDLELVKLLKKEDNGSAVVNALLIAHYSKIKTNKNEEEIIAEAKANIKAEENAIREREYEEMARKEYLEKDKLEWENTPEEEKQRLIEEKNIWALSHIGKLKEEDPGERLLF